MVDGKRACWQASDGEMQGGLYLDPTSKPRSYDLAMTTRTIEGIYSLEGDTLRLCYDMGWESKRPGAFKTAKGSQHVLVVLKRKYGPEVFPYRLADGTRAFPTLVEKAKREPTPPPRMVPAPTATAPTATTPTATTPNGYNTAQRKARVGNIIIVGNTRTATSVILKKIPLLPGDALDYKALKTAEKNLAAFNPTITVEESSGSGDFKDIRVTVREK
jgi:hypothetical protein